MASWRVRRPQATIIAAAVRRPKSAGETGQAGPRGTCLVAKGIRQASSVRPSISSTQVNRCPGGSCSTVLKATGTLISVPGATPAGRPASICPPASMGSCAGAPVR